MDKQKIKLTNSNCPLHVSHSSKYNCICLIWESFNFKLKSLYPKKIRYGMFFYWTSVMLCRYI